MRKLALASLAVAVSLTATACGGGASSGAGTTSGAAGTTGGTLSLGTVQAPTTFVPGDMIASGPVPQLYQPVYDTLVRLDRDANPTPELATSFTYDAAQTTLTLKLRSGITFTDGGALDAAAVKATLDKAMQGTGESGNQLKSVSAVTVTDPAGVQLVLKAPDPSLLRHLGGPAGMIASPKALASASLKTTPVGSGPYVLDAAQSTPGSKYVYTRNATYWGDKASWPFDKVAITVFNDNAALLNAIRANQINSAVIGQKDVSTAKGSGLTVTSFPQYTSSGLYLFDRQGKLTPALGNPKVRQAINHAIDREAFVKNTQGSTGLATAQIFNSDSPAYDAGLNGTYPYDVAKAKQLMAEAGYPNGFTVTMPDSSPVYPQEQAFLTEALKAIGIQVTYEPVNGQTFIGNVLGGRYSMVLFQLTVGSEWDVVTQALQPGSLWNTFHVADPTIDALIAQAQSQTGEAQQGTLKKLNQAVLDAGWFAIINQPAQFVATTKGITFTPEKYASYPPVYAYARG